MPRVRMTGWSRAAIYFLEFYLVVLLVLIVVRFLGVVK